MRGASPRGSQLQKYDNRCAWANGRPETKLEMEGHIHGHISIVCTSIYSNYIETLAVKYDICLHVGAGSQLRYTSQPATVCVVSAPARVLACGR